MVAATHYNDGPMGVAKTAAEMRLVIAGNPQEELLSVCYPMLANSVLPGVGCVTCAVNSTLLGYPVNT